MAGRMAAGIPASGQCRPPFSSLSPPKRGCSSKGGIPRADYAALAGDILSAREIGPAVVDRARRALEKHLAQTPAAAIPVHRADDDFPCATGTALSGGVVAFLLASGFMHWAFQDMRESTIHSQLGHAQVVRPGYFQQGLANPYDYLLPADTTRVPDIAGVKILTVAPRLSFNGLFSRGEDTVSFVGEGIDPARYAALAGRPMDKRRIADLVGHGFIETVQDRLRVTTEGFPVLDAIVADLAA